MALHLFTDAVESRLQWFGTSEWIGKNSFQFKNSDWIGRALFGVKTGNRKISTDDKWPKPYYSRRQKNFCSSLRSEQETKILGQTMRSIQYTQLINNEPKRKKIKKKWLWRDGSPKVVWYLRVWHENQGIKVVPGKRAKNFLLILYRVISALSSWRCKLWGKKITKQVAEGLHGAHLTTKAFSNFQNSFDL